MSYRLRFTEAARADLDRLYRFLAEHDLSAAEAAMTTIGKAWPRLLDSPFSARKADPDNPFLRELVIPFGGAGYVALYEIDNDTTITLLAVRHQREDDYH